LVLKYIIFQKTNHAKKNYIQNECDIIKWGLQNDAKKLQTNAMWLHLIGFVKTCHATRSQQNGCDFLIRFWKLIMRQKKIEQNAWCGF
jgi:hypothetical protein